MIGGIRLLLLLILLSMLAGCSVVSGGEAARAAVFTTLADWQAAAPKAMHQADYAPIQRRVNVWIKAKADEVSLAGTELFIKVDLTIPKELRDKVTALLPPPTISVESVPWKDILDLFLSWYRDSRKAEATQVAEGLRSYLWPDPSK